jgi:hypothetical protein
LAIQIELSTIPHLFAMYSIEDSESEPALSHEASSPRRCLPALATNLLLGRWLA